MKKPRESAGLKIFENSIQLTVISGILNFRPGTKLTVGIPVDIIFLHFGKNLIIIQFPASGRGIIEDNKNCERQIDSELNWGA